MSAVTFTSQWAFSKHKSDVERFPSYVFESRDTVKIMVSANGSLLELAENYKADREIVLTAVKKSTYAAEFMDKALWGDREVAEEAARHSEHDLIFHYNLEAMQASITIYVPTRRYGRT